MTERPFATHDVLNQTPPFEDINLFTQRSPLMEAVARGRRPRGQAA